LNTKKVLELADFLDAVDPHNYDLRRWVNGSTPLVNLENAHSCGTTLCVAGWTVVRHGKTVHMLEETKTEVLGTRKIPFIGKNKTIREVAKEILELTEEEVLSLFFPYGYEGTTPIYPPSAATDPKETAKYIRMYVQGTDPEGYADYYKEQPEHEVVGVA